MYRELWCFCFANLSAALFPSLWNFTTFVSILFLLSNCKLRDAMICYWGSITFLLSPSIIIFRWSCVDLVFNSVAMPITFLVIRFLSHFELVSQLLALLLYKLLDHHALSNQLYLEYCDWQKTHLHCVSPNQEVAFSSSLLLFFCILHLIISTCKNFSFNTLTFCCILFRICNHHSPSYLFSPKNQNIPTLPQSP